MSWKKKFVGNWGQLGMKCKLEDIVDVTMGQSPKSEYYNTEGKGYPFLQGNRTFGFKYPTFDTYTTVITKPAKAGDVIMSVRAPVGDLNITPVDMCLGRGVCSLRMKNGNQDFLFYMMKYYIPHLLKKESGTVFGSVNRNDINGLEVNIPEDAQVQKKIARYLEMIDDKIELNNAINNNLLEQLNLLYAEFSTRNEWPEMTIGDIADKVAMGPFGSNIKVSTFVEYGVPIISGNHLRGYFLEEPSYNYITKEHAEKLKNSVVYPKDIVFTHAGNIGQVAMIPDGCEFPYYVLSQRQFYFRCNTKLVVPEYVLLFFHSKKGQHELLSYANQTGVPSIAQPATNLKKIRLPIPPLNEQKDWLSVVAPIITMYQNNYQESKRLAALRDALLPKFMSGELDVSGIDL